MKSRSLTMAATVLMTVQGTDGAPTLADAAKELGIAVDDLDSRFGVVATDPDKGLYTVQLLEGRELPKRDESKPYQGPYSNPEIAPFGPVQSEPEGYSKKR
jgi:hypothetical protein